MSSDNHNVRLARLREERRLQALANADFASDEAAGSTDIMVKPMEMDMSDWQEASLHDAFLDLFKFKMPSLPRGSAKEN